MSPLGACFWPHGGAWEGNSQHGLTVLFAFCNEMMGSVVEGMTAVDDNCCDFKKDFHTFSHNYYGLEGWTPR